MQDGAAHSDVSPAASSGSKREPVCRAEAARQLRL